MSESSGPEWLREGGNVPQSPYRLVKRLGAGGFGQVWKAVHPTTREEYALKFCLDPGKLLTFRNEARHLVRIKAGGPVEGLVALRGLYDEDGRSVPFVAYEFVEGEDLSKVLRRRFGAGPLSPVEAAEVVLGLADIVARIHALPDPVVHRDLKPQNVMVLNDRPPWRFKIVDFGLGTVAVSTTRAERLTVQDDGRELGGAGTLFYMSPEQADPDHRADPSDDVHALGVVWCELLAGGLLKLGPSLLLGWSHGDWSGLRTFLTKAGLTDPQHELVVSCLRPRTNRPRHAGRLADEIRALFPPVRDEARRDADEIGRLRREGKDWVGHLRAAAAGRRKVWDAGAGGGVPEAHWLLGLCSEQRVVGGQDSDNYVRARASFRAAADAGYAPAQYEFGLYCKLGVGRRPARTGGKASALDVLRANVARAAGAARYEPDPDLAVRYLELAARQGHPDAQYELALCLLERADRTPEDRGRAIWWLKRAADQRHADAWFRLGELLSHPEPGDREAYRSDRPPGG